jgi:nucleotide-binding universal stress UspA family protein
MFTNIIWATDGSEHADRALEYAVQLALSDQAELHVVHVIEKLAATKIAGQDVSLNEEQTDVKVTAQAGQITLDRGVKTTLHMSPGRSGHVATAISGIAEDVGADLIVVGTCGRSVLGGLMLGSVTQRLLHESSCPVLAVPPTAGVKSGSRPAATAAA